jgi:hypothetical protein
MIALLYAFGIGLAVALGLWLGVYFAGKAIGKNSKRDDEWKAHNNRVEQRLVKYVEHTERIALASEALLARAQVPWAGAIEPGNDRERELQGLFLSQTEKLGAITAELGVPGDEPMEKILGHVRDLKRRARPYLHSAADKVAGGGK